MDHKNKKVDSVRFYTFGVITDGSYHIVESWCSHDNGCHAALDRIWKRGVSLRILER